MDESTLNEIMAEFAGKIREKNSDLKRDLVVKNNQLDAVASEQSRLESIITAQKRVILSLVTTFTEETAHLEGELSELRDNLVSKGKELDDVANARECLENLVKSQEGENGRLKETIQNQETDLLQTNTELSNCKAKLQNMSAAFILAEKQGKIYLRQ